MKTLLEVIALFIFTAFIVIILTALFGCNSSSSSGGGQEPAKFQICQNCTYDYQCESNRCAKLKTGTYRCVPQGVTTYQCPQGMYSLTGDSCS